MALRGCVILLFVLLSGSVNADDTATTLAPGMQESSTSQIPTVTQTGSPSSSAAPTTTTLSTTEAPTTMTSKAPTTMTTEAPTTHHNTTNSTTEVPTTKPHIPTTEPPTTPHHNTTNSTTEAPTTAPTTAHTNATTAQTPPPTTPTPTTPQVPKPTVGNYNVRPDFNSSACLLAKMGLQFSFQPSGNASRQTINVDPNVTVATGTCGSGGSNSSLVLKSDKMTVQFVFTNVSEKFRLHALELWIDIGQGSFFNESNTNLSLWEVSIGSSYMCRKEQTYNISDKLTINTFDLQVQPFAVQKNAFSTAEECFLDSDLSFLVPIAVGVALSFLIILVLISYLIGRRKSRTGYQSV
ncbi:lysosome-associated membrane glycoprotein 2 isoform X2 [Triplophysa dalaica]|uniref:lysosome-associated membrane glycoprotein 2 isoform X2 n=1 Tax=Triplophysa dalaica TaxID=1582913 RepID=UPI0024DF3EA0|nr:lysosome-associated membrane glycoprotein 2 isoform X2 [Triplophysa dalaica]